MPDPAGTTTTTYSAEEFLTRLHWAKQDTRCAVDEMVEEGHMPYFVGLALLQVAYEVLKEHEYCDTPDELLRVAEALCLQTNSPARIAANSSTHRRGRRS